MQALGARYGLKSTIPKDALVHHLEAIWRFEHRQLRQTGTPETALLERRRPRRAAGASELGAETSLDPTSSDVELPESDDDGGGGGGGGVRAWAPTLSSEASSDRESSPVRAPSSAALRSEGGDEFDRLLPPVPGLSVAAPAKLPRGRPPALPLGAPSQPSPPAGRRAGRARRAGRRSGTQRYSSDAESEGEAAAASARDPEALRRQVRTYLTTDAALYTAIVTYEVACATLSDRWHERALIGSVSTIGRPHCSHWTFLRCRPRCGRRAFACRSRNWRRTWISSCVPGAPVHHVCGG